MIGDAELPLGLLAPDELPGTVESVGVVDAFAALAVPVNDGARGEGCRGCGGTG